MQKEGIWGQRWQELVMAFGRKGNKEKLGLESLGLPGPFRLQDAKVSSKHICECEWIKRIPGNLKGTRNHFHNCIGGFINMSPMSFQDTTWPWWPVSIQGSTAISIVAVFVTVLPSRACSSLVSSLLRSRPTALLPLPTSRLLLTHIFCASCLLFAAFCVSLSQHQFTPPASPLCLTTYLQGRVWLVHTPLCWLKVLGEANP